MNIGTDFYVVQFIVKSTAKKKKNHYILPSPKSVGISCFLSKVCNVLTFSMSDYSSFLS